MTPVSNIITRFVDVVWECAKDLGFERRFDDGIWWRLAPFSDEVQCLFTIPTMGHVTVCFGGEMIYALGDRPEETRDWVDMELRGALATKVRKFNASDRSKALLP